MLERGIAYLHLGKQEIFTEFGSRYGAVKPSFELYNAFIFARQRALGRRPEDVFGAEQEGWLYQTIDASPGRFLAVASSVSTTSLILLLHVEPEQVTATYHLVDPGELATPLYNDPDALNRRFSTRRFVLRNGSIM